MNKAVLKARYGSELRKNWIYHNNDVSMNDLVAKMQRYFNIEDAANIKLKYRDEGFISHKIKKQFNCKTF
jgi:D-hexose-6-phosphate mutarotase